MKEPLAYKAPSLILSEDEATLNPGGAVVALLCMFVPRATLTLRANDLHRSLQHFIITLQPN